MIGVSTYAYLWRGSSWSPQRMMLSEIVDDVAALGVELVQICDHPELEKADTAGLAALQERVSGHGLTVETGTRGVRREHLLHHLKMAQVLGASLVRSMVEPAHTSPEAAITELRAVMPEFERAEVHLSLETYEQLNTRELIDVIQGVGHPMLGITLDPGNTVAALELPRAVVEETASLVNSVHVKDFAFSRNEGWVGFTYSGALLGEGLLDYAHLLEVVRPEERGINQVLEHWLPWQSSAQDTVAAERDWTRHGIDYIRRNNGHH